MTLQKIHKTGSENFSNLKKRYCNLMDIRILIHIFRAEVFPHFHCQRQLKYWNQFLLTHLKGLNRCL